MVILWVRVPPSGPKFIEGIMNNKQMATNDSAWMYLSETETFIIASFNGKATRVTDQDFDYRLYLKKDELIKLKDFLNTLDI